MKTNNGDKFYDENFYKNQIAGSYRSAKIYVAFLTSIFKFRSVVDVGCGRGTWLKAFKDNGAEYLVGFDGSWNNQINMIDQSIKFIAIDLNKTIEKPEFEFELAMSLEVAEHLEEQSARTFVKSLTTLSNVVMFGAAFTKQGGTNHINEQPHTYWAKIFNDYNYVPYDIFRPVFWGNSDIELWYQQNTFLYVKRGAELNLILNEAGFQPMKNIAFMDCVHPDLYKHKILQASGKNIFIRMCKKVIPKSLIPFFRKIKFISQ